MIRKMKQNRIGFLFIWCAKSYAYSELRLLHAYGEQFVAKTSAGIQRARLFWLENDSRIYFLYNFWFSISSDKNIDDEM